MSDASVKGKGKALPPVWVHFLGTCSGGGPIVSRNCSSTAIDFGNEIWLFDAADGTHSRLSLSPLKMSNITTIFITHLHADHVLGLVPILTTIMSGIGASPEALDELRRQGTRKKARINIYGPKGLRELIRTTLRITSVTLGDAYAVHEILKPGEEGYGCGVEDLHVNEAVGRDVLAESGVWELVTQGGKSGKGWSVTAGPIEHRVTSLGYVLVEPTPREPLDTATLIPLLTSNAAALAQLDPPIKHPLSLLSHLTSIPPPPPFTLPSGEILHPPNPSGVLPRKIVIFGDCNGGTPNPHFQALCMEPSLLIHECTNAAIPDDIQRGEKGRKNRVEGLEHSLVKKYEHQHGDVVGSDHVKECAWDKKRKETQEKARSRGHATPLEVGAFARDIRAERVVVNHFSAMFPAPRYPSSEAFPSITLPIDPFPYPVPHPIAYSKDPPVPPIPLTAGELHLRVTMQSIVDQINELWNDEKGHYKLAVPARDFMVLRIPSHELEEAEMDEQRRARADAKEIIESWSQSGGVWIGAKDERRWVGITPHPP